MVVTFSLPYRCSYGQHLCLVGAGDSLGNWDVTKGRVMAWSDNDVWKADIEIRAGSSVDLEYKYVVRNHDGGVYRWRPGDNYQVSLPLDSEAGTPLACRLTVANLWDSSASELRVEMETRKAQQEAAPRDTGPKTAALTASGVSSTTPTRPEQAPGATQQQPPLASAAVAVAVVSPGNATEEQQRWRSADVQP